MVDGDLPITYGLQTASNGKIDDAEWSSTSTIVGNHTTSINSFRGNTTTNATATLVQNKADPIPATSANNFTGALVEKKADPIPATSANNFTGALT